MYQRFFKRLLDIILSFIGLVGISPILLFVWISLSIANKKGGAFFTQTRPGKNGKLFKVIKFKTMSDKRDSSGTLLPDKDRITSIGKVIRSLSIDELPQIINVIKGDMSLVGPRPLLPRYLGYYTQRESIRHTVRPGITGWAQINGRNNVTWDQKLELDVWYVEHLTLCTDFKILLITIKNVIKREGVTVVVNGRFLDEERKDNNKHLT